VRRNRSADGDFGRLDRQLRPIPAARSRSRRRGCFRQPNRHVGFTAARLARRAARAGRAGSTRPAGVRRQRRQHLAVAERLYGRGMTSKTFSPSPSDAASALASSPVETSIAVSAAAPVSSPHHRRRRRCSLHVRQARLLETVVADPALIARRAAGLLDEQQGIERLREFAREGQLQARQIFHDAGTQLGRASRSRECARPELVLVSGEERRLAVPREAFTARTRTTLSAAGTVPVEVDPWMRRMGDRRRDARPALDFWRSSRQRQGDSVRARLEAVAPAAGGC